MPSTPSDSALTSSRRLTQNSKKFTRDTAGSQSLERGLQLLRAFRVGITVLTNSELATRTGLPRPTVSRLTRSLVDAGFLSYDLERRAYQLAPVCLSLADAYGCANPEVGVALPLMQDIAQREKVNVGLAIADQLEMVYLATFRESADIVSRSRRLVPGSRVPIELTAIGRAYMAGLAAAPREALLAKIAQKTGKGWPALKAELVHDVADIARLGYCTAVWQPGGMIGIGSMLHGQDRTLYAINISFQFVDGDFLLQVQRYAPMLLQLVADITKTWAHDIERVWLPAP